MRISTPNDDKPTKISKSRQSNVMALCVLDSYLTACGIPHEVNDGSQQAFDLLVLKRNQGKERFFARVSVQVDRLARAPDTDILVVVDDVLSLNREKGLEAFHSITEPLGWGKPIPVDRGPEPEGKTHDVHLLVIRHREWRQAPDLPERVLKEVYDPTIKYFSRVFLRSGHAEVIANAGEDFDSLCVIGRIIAHNFHHKYRNVRASAEVNAKYFSQHLKQRFSNAVQQWRRAQTNILPDEQTLSISQTGTIDVVRRQLDGTDFQIERHFDPNSEEDDSYLLDLSEKEATKLPRSVRNRRAKLVQDRQKEREQYEHALLDAGVGLGKIQNYLSMMDHPRRLAVLSGEADKDARFIDPNVKSLAAKLLAEERKRCDNRCCAAYKLEAEQEREEGEDTEDVDNEDAA